MKTAEEYAELAEQLLSEGGLYDYAATKNWNKRNCVMKVGRAQVYATLAQAASVREQTQWWQQRDEQMGLGTPKERSLAVG